MGMKRQVEHLSWLEKYLPSSIGGKIADGTESTINTFVEKIRLARLLHVHCTCTGKVTALGVLCYFALFVCLILLASFFLPSHLIKNMDCYSAHI